MTTGKGLSVYQARGKSPKEAFMALYESLLLTEGIYVSKMSEDDWVVGVNVLPATQETWAKWDKEIKGIYK